MVLVPFLFYGPPLGVTPICGVPHICDDRNDEEQKYQHLHSTLLCYCIPDTLIDVLCRETNAAKPSLPSTIL
jgi:hypothetical protein